MIIHITREIKRVVIFGANGKEDLVRNFFQRQEIEEKIVCKSIEKDYLSHAQLEKYLSNRLKEAMPEEENIQVCAY